MTTGRINQVTTVSHGSPRGGPLRSKSDRVRHLRGRSLEKAHAFAIARPCLIAGSGMWRRIRASFEYPLDRRPQGIRLLEVSMPYGDDYRGDYQRRWQNQRRL